MTERWSAESSTNLAADACRLLQIRPTQMQLLRLGTNANFRLHGTPFVLRIARPEIRREVAEREIAVARALAVTGVPAVVAKSPEPIEVGGCYATLWMWEPIDTAKPEQRAREFGRVIRRLHAADLSDLDLPEWDGLRQIGRYLEIIDDDDRVDHVDRQVLRRQHEDLSATWRPAETRLGVGAVHGDAHFGNTLTTSRGLVLADFETAAIAPREVDLVPLLVARRRFGLSPEVVDEFFDGYGCDGVDFDEGQLDVACRIRELLTTAWLASTDPESPELGTRLAYWRGESDAQWTAR
jgi:aminoglycoside phosphotransferase (APT) family kinase protein